MALDARYLLANTHPDLGHALVLGSHVIIQGIEDERPTAGLPGRLYFAIDVNGGTLGRNIPHHATHHGTARRNIGRLIDLGSRMLSLLVHPFGPELMIFAERTQVQKNLEMMKWRVRRSVKIGNPG